MSPGRHIIDILEGLGYTPLGIKKKDSHQLIYESILRALEWNLGLQVSRTIVNRLCELAGLSEKELLMNYDLFERSLRRTLGGEATAKIVSWVKYRALIEAVVNDSSLNEKEIADPNLSINDILRDIDSVYVFEFIRSLPAHEHVLFLYTNEEIKKKALGSFFDPAITKNNPKGLITSEPINITNDIEINSNRLYEEFLDSNKKDEVVKKLNNWIHSVHLSKTRNKNRSSRNKRQEEQERKNEGQEYLGTRLIVDDASWFLRNGLHYEVLLAEKMAGRHIRENICILCIDNLLKLMEEVQKADQEKDEVLKNLIALHSYVILDSPFAIYKVREKGS
jgi:hypothetical protein